MQLLTLAEGNGPRPPTTHPQTRTVPFPRRRAGATMPSDQGDRGYRGFSGPEADRGSSVQPHY